MFCVVKHGKYLKVQDQSVFEELHKMYVCDNKADVPEMLAGGFGTYEAADREKQRIAIEIHEKKKLAKAGLEDKEKTVLTTVTPLTDGAEKKQMEPAAVVIPEIRESVQPMLGEQFVPDDFMIAAAGGSKDLPVFTGEQYVRSHPREAKLILMMRYGLDMSYDVIAEHLGCSPQTASAVCNREAARADIGTFRKMFSERLKNHRLLLMDAMEKKVKDPEELKKTPMKDLVWALRTIADYEETMTDAGKSTSAQSGKESDSGKMTKPEEELAKKYLDSLTKVTTSENQQGEKK